MSGSGAIDKDRTKMVAAVREALIAKIVAVVNTLPLDSLAVLQAQVEAHQADLKGAPDRVINPSPSGVAPKKPALLSTRAYEWLDGSESPQPIEAIATFLYGSAIGQHRKAAREVMSALQRKGQVVERDGKWSSATAQTKTQGLVTGSQATLVIEAVKASTVPLSRQEIATWVLERIPDASRESVKSAVTKQAGLGRLKVKDGRYTLGDVE